jgi:hypothetical protein
MCYNYLNLMLHGMSAFAVSCLCSLTIPLFRASSEHSWTANKLIAATLVSVSEEDQFGVHRRWSALQFEASSFDEAANQKQESKL